MVVASIDTLKAATIPIDNFANVLGYTTAGDGGGGDFYYDSSDTTSAENGGTIFLSTASGATGRWKRLYSEALSVKWFGVKGDGNTDDTFKINNAISHLPVDATLFFPTGIYLVSSTLTLSSKTNVILEADSNVTIQMTGSGSYNTTCFSLITCSNIKIDNFNIIGTSLQVPTIVFPSAILLQGSDHCIITNNKINNYSGCGIYLAPNGVTLGCSYNRIAYNKVTNCIGQQDASMLSYVNRLQDMSGILVGYSGTGYFHHDNIIEYNFLDMEYLTSHGIAFLCHGYNNRVLNNTVQNCLSYGILIYETEYGDGSTMLLYNNVVDKNYISNIGVPNAGQANIYINTPTQNALTTSLTGGSLPASTTYYVVVTAIGTNGETARSLEQSITTGSGTTNSIGVSWIAVPGAASYNIYIGTAAKLENQQFNVVSGTSFTITTATSTTATPIYQLSFGQGIYTQKGHRSIVTNNYIINTCINTNQGTLNPSAINVNGSIECIIENNIVDTCGYNGINQSYNYGGVISNNKIYNCLRYGIFNHLSSNVSIDNNIVYNSTSPSLNTDARYTGDADINGNTLYYPVRNTYAGINVRVSNNTFTQLNNSIPIGVNGVAASTGITAANAQFVFSGNKVISQLYGLNGNYFIDSIINNNRFELSSASGIAISCNSSTSNYKIINNHIWATNGSISQMINSAGFNAYIEGNTYAGTASYYINKNGLNFNSVSPKRVFFGGAIPTVGDWLAGDKIYNVGNTNYIGWVCIAPGTPGTWIPFGRAGVDEDKPRSGSARPIVTTVGFLYFDTTINREVIWNGSTWLDNTAPATTTATGVVMQSTALTSATPMNAAGATPTAAEFDAVVIRLNELVAKLQAAGIQS